MLAADGVALGERAQLREVVRLTYAMRHLRQYSRPKAVTRSDTVDVAHGHQQLALFNAHHDERCFMPPPVAVLLRPGKTPSGFEVRSHVSGWCAASGSIGRIRD